MRQTAAMKNMLYLPQLDIFIDEVAISGFVRSTIRYTSLRYILAKQTQ